MKANFANDNMKELLNNSVLIETHTDKGIGTDRENARLKQVYVLMSLLDKKDHVVPVQFEIKEYINNDNRLYLAVALSKIETSVLAHTASDSSLTDRTDTDLYYNYSIADIFKNIITKDYKFLKYIPDRFLNDSQLKAKAVALEEDEKKYTPKMQARDKSYLSAVERGDMETAQRMVDEAAKAAGYNLHLYHGAKFGSTFTVFKDWQYFTADKEYAEKYTQRNSEKNSMYEVYVNADRIFDTTKPENN